MASNEHRVNSIIKSNLVSTFTDEGACTSPLGISNWNVQLSDDNVLQNYSNYSFEI